MGPTESSDFQVGKKIYLVGSFKTKTCYGVTTCKKTAKAYAAQEGLDIVKTRISEGMDDNMLVYSEITSYENELFFPSWIVEDDEWTSESVLFMMKELIEFLKLTEYIKFKEGEMVDVMAPIMTAIAAFQDNIFGEYYDSDLVQYDIVRYDQLYYYLWKDFMKRHAYDHDEEGHDVCDI